MSIKANAELPFAARKDLFCMNSCVCCTTGCNCKYPDCCGIKAHVFTSISATPLNCYAAVQQQMCCITAAVTIPISTSILLGNPSIGCCGVVCKDCGPDYQLPACGICCSKPELAFYKAEELCCRDACFCCSSGCKFAKDCCAIKADGKLSISMTGLFILMRLQSFCYSFECEFPCDSRVIPFACGCMGLQCYPTPAMACFGIACCGKMATSSPKNDQDEAPKASAEEDEYEEVEMEEEEVELEVGEEYEEVEVEEEEEAVTEVKPAKVPAKAVPAKAAPAKAPPPASKEAVSKVPQTDSSAVTSIACGIPTPLDMCFASSAGNAKVHSPAAAAPPSKAGSPPKGPGPGPAAVGAKKRAPPAGKGQKK